MGTSWFNWVYNGLNLITTLRRDATGMMGFGVRQLSQDSQTFRVL